MRTLQTLPTGDGGAAGGDTCRSGELEFVLVAKFIPGIGDTSAGAGAVGDMASCFCGVENAAAASSEQELFRLSRGGVRSPDRLSDTVCLLVGKSSSSSAICFDEI